MKTLFDSDDRAALLARIARLQPDTAPRWGKMNAAQALRHCALALETATGDRPMKQRFLGKIVTPFIRKMVLGEKPFSKNSPTDPTFASRQAQSIPNRMSPFSAPRSSCAQFVPATVDVMVRGNREGLSRMRADDLIAFVDVAGVGAGEYLLPVRVESTREAGVTEIDPSAVKVRITRDKD